MLEALVEPTNRFTLEHESNGRDLVRRVAVGDRISETNREAPTAQAGDAFADWWKAYLQGQRPRRDRSKEPVRFIDLFSSVGGLSLGASEAIESMGMRPLPLLAADVDAGALDVYARNLRPRQTLNESISGLVDYRISGTGEGASFAYEPTVRDDRLAGIAGTIDLILAGPPCQGHSSLNNYSRHDDPKNLLYLSVPAVAVATQAAHVVIENVPNVVADKHGVVQTSVALLRSAGYRITSGVIAAHKMGWPQTRRRFFIVASRDSQPLDLLGLQAQLSRDALPVGWLLQSSLDDIEEGDIMRSVPQMSVENRARIAHLFDNDEYDLPNSIRPDCHREGTTYGSSYGRMAWDEPAPTITGGFLTPGRGRFVHPLRRRVLTPREAARVQGFPDWYDFVADRSRPASRAQLTRWIGNAVPTILGQTAVHAALAGSKVDIA